MWAEVTCIYTYILGTEESSFFSYFYHWPFEMRLEEVMQLAPLYCHLRLMRIMD
jgi:hypothetical protein